MWNEAISLVPLNSNNFLNSKWAYYYIENHLMYQEYTAKDFSFDNRQRARKEGNIHNYLIGIAKKYLKGENLEFYTSSYILSTAWQNKFEKELISLFEEYKTDFPNSKYTASLEPHIEKIIAFHKRAEQKFDENSKFLSKYENINSLAECVKTFSGKKVYVDIWTTSCGPCKDEFKYSEDLEQLLLSNNTAMLYISLDSDNTDTRWKDMIKFYQLTGYHVRANKELEADLEKILGSLWIPRYLLIDGNGKIANNNAKRPSQLKDLEKQITGK
jgi:thiol-disulfide isomerase/thioredoxin